MSRIPTRDLRAAEGLNAFFIMPAHARGFSLSTLFSTHPPPERRIERLLAMQAQLDASPTAIL
jgi:heat shock protein HtpX